ncbi:hypothetical protein OGAPHI_006536 [Ogataea philodendri]|uniref:RRM domain-containing protein n=1 Tax=Ogataea philodendri TaxID=1378263 RepID=A0A9P8T1H4_9ASCO|nr:uncharacterized protein OGAPHI_006536 [Ogataea philodendri]KAH3661686.1 hypothetical protein OGAPHI_006536 [Ogataea philodendri]
MSVRTLYVRNLNEKLAPAKLRAALERLFTETGVPVADIRLFKNLRLRGQAFITLSSHNDCLRAIDSLNTKLLYNKPLDMYLAKTNSDLAMENEPDFDAYLADQRRIRLENRTKKRKLAPQTHTTAKKRRLPGARTSEPNKILLLTNLPPTTTKDQVVGLFESYTGFLNVNLVQIRNLALVEFRSETESARCLDSLGNSVKINGSDCYLQFAKK